MVVIGQSGCFREKLVVLGNNWLYLGKNGCIQIKDVVFGQTWL